MATFKPLEQLLYEACAQGRIEEVELLLARSVYPNCETNDGQTPFWIACQNGRTEVVKVLLNDERVLVNKANHNSQTPFWIACEKGHVEVVNLLLNDERIDVNKANSDDQTPFWIACYNGRTEVVKLLLNDENIDINKADKGNTTPLYIACEKGHVEIVKLLLNDERIDVNKATISDDQTPFWIACYRKHIEVVKLLLSDERIDINKNNRGGTRQNGIAFPQGTPFLIACRSEVTEIAQHILASGKEVDLNEKDNEGNTIIDVVRNQIDQIEQQQQQQQHRQQYRQQHQHQQHQPRMKTFEYDPAPYEARKKKTIETIELLESFKRNPTETRTKLRNQLGLPGKI